jgi:uncharacterized tellurite resistance protein B-like protein
MGILDQLMNVIKTPTRAATPELQHNVVLGAMLSLVAEAEGGVVPTEVVAMRKVLQSRGVNDPSELDEIIAAAQQTLKERMDWEGFTREINQHFEYEDRVSLVVDLFRIARADNNLSNEEHETIRKLSDLMWVSHEDFIKAKLASKAG